MTRSGLSIIELQEIADREPVAPEAVELIERLCKSDSTRSECRERCFRYLARDPGHHQVRLLLAQSYYLDGLGEFCGRELEQIALRGGKSESLSKLLEKFSGFLVTSLESEKPSATSDECEEALAEIDFDSDFTDALEDLLDEDEDDDT